MLLHTLINRIFIKTGEENNLLELARKNPILKEKYKQLLLNDYVLYFHKDGISRFIKRILSYEVLDENKYISDNEIFYTLQEPFGRKINEKVEKKLLVIFSKMPGSNFYDSAKLPHRMLPSFFEGIERNLVKNVYIMRIMDLNVSHGSHYVNTINFPDYEKRIQETLKNVIKNLTISKKNVVFYGVSRGGAGALLHGSFMDIKTLAVDPIVNIGGEMYANDRRLLKGLRKDDLVPVINENSEKLNQYKKIVICSENSRMYYNEIIRLKDKYFKLINVRDNKITTHPEVSQNTVPEQLMILNNLLTNFKYFQ
ncbi:accessory Sec system protein Asp2 [Staphylococcus ureilyticus]|uniref:accessory Sec system protein Asp2 n=1 Tax=Staphylococcus ureilyticus TaxID=94138 RepID=UPI0034DD6244